MFPSHDQGEYDFKKATLKEIMRQTGEHPVVDASFIIRNNLTVQHPIPTLKTDLKDDKGIIFIDGKTERKTVRPILKEYFDTPEFKADADYAKVIAWRNKTVAYLNGIIREILFGKDASPYMVGEKLIARGPIFEEQKGSKWGSKWVVKINTSEEMEISELQVKTKKFKEGSHTFYAQIYECKILIYDPMTKKASKDTIDIIHEESWEEYRRLIKKTKDLAIRACDRS